MDVAETQAPPAELMLDPFVYVPDMASRIEGLGGRARAAEGDYAFHTAYVEAEEGVAHFSGRFDGLTATKGTLNLRVHMLSSDSPHARLATAERVALNRLASGDGHFSIRFEAFHGVTYALYGGVIGDTDATAHSLHVVLDRPADPSARREIAAEARNSAFGSDAISVPHIVSLNMPLLSAPVTQFATARQLRRDSLSRWPELGSLAELDDLGRWIAVYIVEALQSFGMVEPGARGAGMGARLDWVASALARRGLRIDLVTPPSGEIERSAGAASDALHHDEGVRIRPAALDPIAPELVNYDLIWSYWTADGHTNARDHARFLEASLACLRPAGLAVHVVAYNPDSDGDTSGFKRQDVERIILMLISRGHDVAEFKIEANGLLVDARGLSACGIICRKAPLSD